MNGKEIAHTYQNLLRSGSWFKSLPDSLQKELLDAAVVLSLKSGQLLFAQGESEQGLYAVISGVVSIGRNREDGKEALLTLMESPNWFGEITLFDRMNRTHNAFAVADSVLIHVSGEKLDQILATEPRYWQNFGQLLTSKVRILLNQAEDLALRTTAQRLAKRLVLFAESYDSQQDRSRRVISIQQEQLALMLNITRQTTNQILKDLERHELLKLVYGAIEIIDLDGLRTFSDQFAEKK